MCGDIINSNPTKEELKGLKKEPSKRRLDKEYLLEFLRYFNEKEGRPPKKDEFENNSKYPHFSTIQRAFGSWNKALELAGFKPRIGGQQIYTKEELLEYPIRFYNEKGRPPTEDDFNNNPKYPHFSTFYNRFGSFQNALKLVGIDLDSMVTKGIKDTSQQKARLFELQVKMYLGEEAIDLAGQNCNSPYDGTFKNQTYDAKARKLFDEKYWLIDLDNVHKDEIQTYYLGLFDEKFDVLLYVLEIPAWDFMEDIEKEFIQIGISNRYKYNIENMMKDYDITEKFKIAIGINKNILSK